MTRLPGTIVWRAASWFAVGLLYAVIWGFAGIGKLQSGVPAWFGDKFGGTFLARFPGLSATFWLLTISELAAFVLFLLALLSGEWLARRTPRFLAAGLVWSLFVFIQLGFGQWLTAEFNGAFQQFVYFVGTLVALDQVLTKAGVTGDRTAQVP